MTGGQYAAVAALSFAFGALGAWALFAVAVRYPLPFIDPSVTPGGTGVQPGVAASSTLPAAAAGASVPANTAAGPMGAPVGRPTLTGPMG